MDEKDIAEMAIRTEERAKSNTKRIDKLETVVDEIHNLGKTMIVLVEEVKHTNTNVNDIKEKVEVLEKEPGERWKASTKAFFNAFLGAVGTAVAGGVLWLITQM